MKRFLSIAAILIVIGALASWLWPGETAAPTLPAPAAAPTPASQEIPRTPAAQEQTTIRVAFINHLGDANIHFTVDGVSICSAKAGHSCYGDVRFGKHVVHALEGKKVVRTLDLSLDENTANPTVVVCFPTSPNC